ncbi:MAG: FxsA family protein, partial [SAR86 cluster bacterium]|nr:FxsA family protein [SAR86 cluster bacterium]
DPTADNILKTLFTPIGGFLMLIPGFVTDFLGLLILLPFTRIFLIGLMFSYIGSLNNKPMNKKPNEDWIEGEYKKDK